MRPPLGRMGGELGGRDGEDQPPASCIHRVEAKRVLEERARGRRVVGEQNRVQPDDHLGGLAVVLTEP